MPPRGTDGDSGERRSGGRQPAGGQGEKESRGEKLNRELMELLNELRVALPGVQVLFAFLLTVPFTPRFEGLADYERAIFFATFLCTAAATAFLMAPTAFHRLRWRRRDKERMLMVSNRLALVGLVLLAAAVTLAVYLIADLVMGPGIAAAFAAGCAGLLVALWFVLPLAGRRDGEPGPG